MVVFQYSSTFPYSWNNFCCFRIPIYGHEETQIISRKKDTKFVYEMTCLFTHVGVYDISSIHSPNRFSHECYSRVMGFLLIFVLVSQLQGPCWAIDPGWNCRSLSLPRRCKFCFCSTCLFWPCTPPSFTYCHLHRLAANSCSAPAPSDRDDLQNNPAHGCERQSAYSRRQLWFSSQRQGVSWRMQCRWRHAGCLDSGKSELV